MTVDIVSSATGSPALSNAHYHALLGPTARAPVADDRFRLPDMRVAGAVFGDTCALGPTSGKAAGVDLPNYSELDVLMAKVSS